MEIFNRILRLVHKSALAPKEKVTVHTDRSAASTTASEI